MEIDKGQTVQALPTSRPFRTNDIWARVLGIPVVAFFMHLQMHKEANILISSTGLQGYLISMLFTISYWEGLRVIWKKLQERFPHYTQTGRRIGYLILAVLVYGAVVTLVIENFIAFIKFTPCGPDQMIKGYFKGLIPTTLVLLLYETVYFFHSWKTKVMEAEAISKAQLVSQLDALRNQLDPHFLFNSLNALSSLIDENPPAQEYLSRLSDVYRYVLINRDRDLVTLREEMQFVHAFLYLARVRFQTGLEVEERIPESLLDTAVAPLSVQLLVENALKHNAITREMPLKIDIWVADGYLWVGNPIRRKVHLENSTRVGLQNILERYRLLHPDPVKILRGTDRFEVALPLLYA
jgi:sensor histidine kinase YesM